MRRWLAISQGSSPLNSLSSRFLLRNGAERILILCGSRESSSNSQESDREMAFLNYVDHSMAMPTDAIDESHSPDVVEGRSDHLSGDQEMAYIWRRPELRGVELFRGVYKRYHAARHFHLSPAIGIVSQGVMSSYARGATHTLPTGTVFLINPGEVHAPGPALPRGWELRAFYFSNDFYAELSRSLGLEDVRFSELFVNDELLTQRLLSLHRSLEQSSSRLELQSKLLSIFGELAQRYAQVPLNNRTPPEHGKVIRAKEFLIENYRRVITLDTLAKIVNLSPYYLLRTFRSNVGITPHDFLTQIRVERAKRLLRLGNSISDVAADTGFVDQAHLTRRFREIMGVTPGRYLSSRTNRRRKAAI
jgi:AraC-like DNA-binding protein